MLLLFCVTCNVTTISLKNDSRHSTYSFHYSETNKFILKKSLAYCHGITMVGPLLVHPRGFSHSCGANWSTRLGLWAISRCYHGKRPTPLISCSIWLHLSSSILIHRILVGLLLCCVLKKVLPRSCWDCSQESWSYLTYYILVVSSRVVLCHS